MVTLTKYIYGGIMNTQQKRWIMVVVSILLSALGNAMLSYSGLGNTYWGVAAENISALTNIEYGTSILILMLVLYVFNRIALKEFRPLLDTLSLITTFAFGYIINIFLGLLSSTIDLTNNIILTNMMWFFGLVLMTMGISMYLKINLIVPAFDENLDVLAKKYFNNNYVKASLVSVIVAMIITMVVGFLNNMTFVGFNVYSIITIVTFGHFIQFFHNNMKFYDRFIDICNCKNSNKTLEDVKV